MTSEAKPVLVPCRSQNGHECPSYAHLIYPMLWHRIIHLPTRNRLLLLHFQYILVFMKVNFELKSHYVLSPIRMLQGQHVLVSSQNSPVTRGKNNYIKLYWLLKCYYRPTASLQLNNKRNTKYNISVT